MSEEKMITLGGKEFPIAPLTMGQLRQASPSFFRLGFDTPDGVGAYTTLIYLAMHNANTKLTPADVDAIVGVGLQELTAAVEKIAKLMSVVVRNNTPGEAKPVAPAMTSPASTGSKSTAA